MLVKLVNDANGEHLVVFYTVCNPQICLKKIKKSCMGFRMEKDIFDLQ